MEKARTVRQRVLVQGVSERQVAREMGIGRNTVRRYVDGAEPGVRRPAARAAPILEKVRARMAEILAESPGWTTRKQRLTAFRLHEMLLEDGHSVGYTTVKSFVWEWRRERAEVFVPLEYRAGDLAEVDFFEVTVDEGGVRRKAFKFLMRLMYSGCDFIYLYDRQDQVSFLDAHLRAFAHFGFVPRRILYDNLKAAVARILIGSQRELARRFSEMAQHHLFEPCFARPYTGHDKGGVEARGKGIRLRSWHPRQKRGGRSVDYRHFLPELARKPNAVRQVAHRLVYDMGEPWPTVWCRLVASFGEVPASRLFAELLRGVEQLGAQVMAERLAPILARNEPPLLALVRSDPPEALGTESIPENLRDVIVEQASAASFDALMGGAL